MTGSTPSAVAISEEMADDACLLVADGVLDATTYLELRNAIIKAALDHPRAVVVDMTRLAVPAESALAVFPSARWYIGRWPDVPLLLVCRHGRGRESLARNGVARYTPVYDSTTAALAALASGDAVARRRARTDLIDPSTSGQARLFVTDCLTSWGLLDLLPAVKFVVTALLENVFAHTTGPANLRLESDGNTVTVAIADTSPAMAAVQEGLPGDKLSGLLIVDALCTMWGNSPTPTGKTVWAVIGPENHL